MSRLCKKFSAGAVVDHRGGIEDTLCGKLRFSKNKMGTTQYNISRPAFRAGSTISGNYVPNLRPNQRRGLGNRNMERNNFLSPNIKGREVIDFERLEALDVEQAGIKVQLGDKTLEQLFKIQIDDPSDIAWIQEKERRLRAGETEAQIREKLPLGRPQRKISKMTNFGEQSLSVDDKLELLKTAALQGSADNKNSMARLIASTASILSDVDSLKSITSTGYADLKQLVSRMFIKKNWAEAGFKQRIWSYEEYRRESGLINLFLLSNIEVSNVDGRTLEKPVVSFNDMGNLTGRLSIVSLATALNPKGPIGNRTPSRYLDLQLKAIIPFNAVVRLANQGVDNGMINGEPRPEEGWSENVLPRWDLPRNQRGNPPEDMKIQG